jgi:hypothetical protein
MQIPLIPMALGLLEEPKSRATVKCFACRKVVSGSGGSGRWVMMRDR